MIFKMYLASIYPDRISIRWEGNRRSTRTQWEEKQLRHKALWKTNLEQKKETWNLSYQTKKKIIDSSNFLIHLSPPRTVQVSNKKQIYNYQASFITLTLPSPQQHADQQIKKCLNNFLTTLRTKYNLKNYVWKAELQQNQNIHFHLIIDKYIHYNAIRYYWNKAINVLGYVDRYREKWSAMDFKQYCAERNVSGKDGLNGFLQGVKTKWNSPGTENVKNVVTPSMLSYYVSKYMAKDENNAKIKSDVERIKAFGRVWARSQSLSAVKVITRYCWKNLKNRIKTIDSKLNGLKVKHYDYCTVIYFDWKNLSYNFKRWIRKKIHELGMTYQYPFPDTIHN